MIEKPRRYRTRDARRGLGIVKQTDMRRLVAYVPVTIYEKLSEQARAGEISNSARATQIITEYLSRVP